MGWRLAGLGLRLPGWLNDAPLAPASCTLPGSLPARPSCAPACPPAPRPAVVNASLSFGQLSYRDTDATPASSARYHPLIQQKRLVTGQAKGSEAQAVRGGMAPQ